MKHPSTSPLAVAKVLAALVSLLLQPVSLHAQANNDGAMVFVSAESLGAMLKDSFDLRKAVEPAELSREEATVFTEKVVPAVGAGDYAAAIRELQAIVQPTSNANVNFTLATLHLQQAQYDQAIEQYRAAIQKVPGFLRAHKNLGIAYTQKGAYAEAIPSLVKAMTLGEYSNDLFGLLGYNYFQMGDFTAALQAYRMASLLEPANKDWKVGLLRCMLETKAYGDAAKLADELILANPSDPRYWISRANAYIGMDKYTEAMTTLEALRRTGHPTPQGLRLLADLYLNSGMLSLASRTYVEYFTARLVPAEALKAVDTFVRRNALDEAVPLVEYLATRDKEFTADQHLELRGFEARVRIEKGDPQSGIQILKQILTESPLHGTSMLLLAELLISIEDFEEAKFYLDQASRLNDPKIQHNALINLASLSVRQKDYESAAKALRQAVRVVDDQRTRDYLEAVENAVKASRGAAQ